MLPAGKHVRQVYADCVIGAAPTDAILIDCSTIDIASAKAVAAQAADQGYQMVDAPVSGGIAAANGGTLTFMVGGSDEGFARAQPILAAMGKLCPRAADPGGNGQGRDPCRRQWRRPGR